MTRPWHPPVQDASTHVDQIGILLRRTNDALDSGWEDGDAQKADEHLALIEAEARRARAALRPLTGRPRVRLYIAA